MTSACEFRDCRENRRFTENLGETKVSPRTEEIDACYDRGINIHHFLVIHTFRTTEVLNAKSSQCHLSFRTVNFFKSTPRVWTSVAT